MRTRALKFVLTLGVSKFSNGTNQKIIYSTSLPGYLHAQVNLERTSGTNGNNTIVNIFGMLIEDCNSLSILNPDSLSVSDLTNQIQIYADYIDPKPNPDGTYNEKKVTQLCDNMPLVFLGQIISASPNYNDVNRPFTIQAILAGASSYKLLPATIIKSPQSFSTVVSTLITKLNKITNSNYVLGSVVPQTQVTSGVYNNSFMQQLEALCNDYGYKRWDHWDKGKCILDFTQVGTGLDVASSDLAPDEGDYTGMIGYPISAPFGILVKTYYNPNRNVSEVVNLTSWATIYNGNWRIWSVSSALCTQDENWDSTITLYKG